MLAAHPQHHPQHPQHRSRRETRDPTGKAAARVRRFTDPNTGQSGEIVFDGTVLRSAETSKLTFWGAAERYATSRLHNLR